VPSIASKIKAISTQTHHALWVDRMAVLKELKRIHNANTKGADSASLHIRLERLAARLEASATILHQRQQPLPDLNIDPQLPIAQRKDELVAAIAAHRVLVVSGETGSGKTTQIPKFCLLAGRGTFGTIGVTQPRRIAAISVSRRIAQELGPPHESMVGYKIRFKDTTQSQARIKIMTDGILLAEAHRDPFLNQYDTLVVDEAHERSLNIDFILGILKKLLHKRPNLNLIITSATIDTEKFSAAFDQAPIIQVSGRLYPVEVRYDPASDSGDEESSYVEQAVQAVDRLTNEKTRGDILIFMPTERDIRDTCELLEGRRIADTRIIPLFARLSADEQQKVFQSVPGRKIVVATNVAETSITIPGIHYVIDTGLARISQYTPRSRTTTLPVVPISRSSADQRKGRCGRVANGICIRL
jgi:ATP-dependent helicase HrpA